MVGLLQYLTLTWHNDLFALLANLKETELAYGFPIKHVHGMSLSFRITLHSLHLTVV